MSKTILVTGFEPYGGMAFNPAHAAMERLHGETIAGFRIAGRALTVSIASLEAELRAAIAETSPLAVICLGLYPGESAIRIERVGLNLADFKLADNRGRVMADTPLLADGQAARWSSLPVRAIEKALLEQGTPARLSQTAGTYLCNACLYHAIGLAGGRPAGFLHLPLTPEMVAGQLANAEGQALEREPPPSMELARIIAGVRAAIAATAQAVPGT